MKRRTLLPWWLRPWDEARWLRAELHSAERAAGRQALDITGLERRIESDQRVMRQQRDDLAKAEHELRRLRGQLAGAVTDAKVSGAALSTAQPEFVLVGIPRPDGSKRLMASRNLDVTAFAMTDPDQPPPRWKLGVILARLLVIDKPDYQQALAHLMTIWANQDSDARAQVTGKRALDAGSQWDRPNPLPRGSQ